MLTANLLAAAVLTPVLGRLGDLRGERPVILGILVTVSLGTLLAIVTTSLPLLLLARVLQGASYGLFPLSIGVLRRELPHARLGVAMSVVSSTLGVGGVVGLVATGLLSGNGADYRTPFWLGLGVALLSLALAARVLPRRPPTASGRVDWWGALVLGAGLVLLLLPISQGHTWGWALPGRARLPGRGGRRARRAGSSCNAGSPNRWSVPRCSPTTAPSCRTWPG